MKIGIMGGTFDPIHNGHLSLGAKAYEQFELDEVWFLPNGNPPHKSRDTKVSDRVEMVRLAIAGDSRFSLNTYEADKTSKSYSCETLETFHKMYPEHEFYFIIGADSLFSIEKWYEPSRVMKACILLAACRDDKDSSDIMRQIEYLMEKYEADIRFLSAPVMDVSSSDIRKRCAQKEEILSLVPVKVAEYITCHHLYKDVDIS